MTSFYLYVLFLGAVAGFTIYLGLPIARFNPGKSVRAFLTAASVGILLFIFVEVAYRLSEQIEDAMKLSAMRLGPVSNLYWNIALFVGGFSVSILSLVLFELRFLKKNAHQPAAEISPRRVAL